MGQLESYDSVGHATLNSFTDKQLARLRAHMSSFKH